MKGGGQRRGSLFRSLSGARGGAARQGGKSRIPRETAYLALAFLLPLVFLVTSFPTAYVLQAPGPSFDLQAGVKVEGAETHTSRGEFLLTSVSLRESNLLDRLLSLAGRDYDFLEARRFLGPELDVESQDRVDAVLTLLSRQTAEVLALREASKEVEVSELGALVVGVSEGSPAQGKIAPGEVIVSVGGVPIRGSVDLAERIASLPEVEEVSVGVRGIAWEELGAALGRGEEADPSELLTGDVRETRLVPIWDGELEKMVIGVYTRDYFAYRSPVRVAWELGSIRGPSAGLMMSLSLLNALLPGDLTRGRRVAGTGEVFLDGRVGAVGGLIMKVRSAEERGAEVFLYPRQNQGDLEGVKTGMMLIPVDTLHEALQALAGLST